MAKPDMVEVDKCQSELTTSSSDSSATGTTAIDCSENFSFRNKNATSIVGLHDGHHKKDKGEPVLESTADSDILQRSPWMCDFTSSFKQHNAASQDSQQCIDSCNKVSHEEGTCAVAGGLTRTSELRPICHLSDLMIDDIIGWVPTDMDCSTSLSHICASYSCGSSIAKHKNFYWNLNPSGEEIFNILDYWQDVSDHNFVDEEKGEKMCSESLLKRLKTVEPDASSDG